LTTAEAALVVASGSATMIGAAGLLVVGREARPRLLAALLGLTGGVMLAAASFSLLVPALDQGGVGEVVAGFLAGAGAVALLDRLLPHAHRLATGDQAALADAEARRRGSLLLAAMTIHNVPEGLSVGVAFAVGGPEIGVPVAVAIGLQNIPEGFVAGVALLSSSLSRPKVAAIAGSTGLVEPVAAFAAFGAATAVGLVLSGALAFAAGAMVYVVVDELLPEAYGEGQVRAASLALVCGFGLMLFLDNALA
jgi:zinc transporter, ZIP family